MINGATYRDAIISASHNVSNNRKNVDALNVFPVPDGDTGTNMSMTIQSAAKELGRLPDDVTVTRVADVTASAMLRGARGNSGVILSLIFRGISKGLKGMTEIGPRDIVVALSYGVESAYKAVMKPTEGTILTVVRLATKAGARYGTENKEAEFAEVFQHVIEGAQEALDQTPELLPVLKKAGVVDAGGQGLLLVFRGMQSVFDGTGMIPDESEAAAAAGAQGAKAETAPEKKLKYAYCVEYIVNREPGSRLDPLGLRAYLESIGDCVAAVSDDRLIKVHVHTNDPGKAVQEGQKYGSLVKIKIDNMRQPAVNVSKNSSVADFDLDKLHKSPTLPVEESTKQPAEEPQNDGKQTLKPVEPTEEVGFVAVAAGEGMKQMFLEIGVNVVVSGGQTMNPSTEDLLNAVEATPGRTVFILPNNKNIIMAAEQVDPISTRNVIVLPTRTIPQGISSMLHYDPDASIEDNHMAMTKAFADVDTAQVTFAARDSVIDGIPIKKGQMLGMENGAITVVEDNAVEAAYRVTRRLCSRKTTMVTIFYGEGAKEEDADKLSKMLADRFSNIETDVVYGGQPVYSFIISVE